MEVKLPRGRVTRSHFPIKSHTQDTASAIAGKTAVSRKDLIAILLGVLAAVPSTRRERCMLTGGGLPRAHPLGGARAPACHVAASRMTFVRAPGVRAGRPQSSACWCFAWTARHVHNDKILVGALLLGHARREAAQQPAKILSLLIRSHTAPSSQELSQQCV